MNDETSYRSIWSHLATVEHRQAWVTTGDFDTRYVETGKRGNPPLIMIHGTGGSWEAFCANIGPLSEHFNCFALDMVGCGYTGKPDRPYEIAEHVAQIVRFMDALELKTASLVGISMGSWTASRFALAHPERTERLVILSAFGLSDDQEEIGAILTRRGKAFDAPTWASVKDVFDKLILDEANRIDDLIGLRLQTYSQPAMKAAGENILAVFKPEPLARNLVTPDEWRRIEVPTLIVVAVDDRPLYVKTARTLAGYIPGATAVEVSGVGHWPQFEAPEKINGLVSGFLRGQARTGR
ncbi:alpha/beta fold hydrolase [Pigmentiphaga sp. H8]|uniref:alpha/beta fold hydrolase n=1 Tax=Pigmentiphaga sp. H8 TaxID=2488560 RepID=UPI001EE148F3|nr:alpha/beta hydrolase [Pigmentiphaga sp. H8]